MQKVKAFLHQGENDLKYLIVENPCAGKKNRYDLFALASEGDPVVLGREVSRKWVKSLIQTYEKLMPSPFEGTREEILSLRDRACSCKEILEKKKG